MSSGAECIILAGGLGTRLREAVPGLPKCMAPVAGRPFMYYVINYLLEQKVQHFIFSLGYMHDVIQEYINDEFPLLDLQYSIEDEPLGTGGAIKLACKKTSTDNILMLNGDTMYKIHVNKLLTFHTEYDAACTIALKPMHDFDRYGVVEINQQNYIQSFKEKQFYRSGLINGGAYALNMASFLSLSLPEKFSFEKDYLEKFHSQQNMMGLIQDEYFIDIGITEDYKKANVEFMT